MSGSAGESAKAQSGSSGRDFGAAAARLASQTPSRETNNTSAAQSSYAGNAAAMPPPPQVDHRALEQTRDSFAKLGIRAGTIQESARTLTEEQAKMGVSLRGDIRASLKRMEYLMDRAEKALDKRDLDDAKSQMDAAEREIEKLEKFFRI